MKLVSTGDSSGNVSTSLSLVCDLCLWNKFIGHFATVTRPAEGVYIAASTPTTEKTLVSNYHFLSGSCSKYCTFILDFGISDQKKKD